MSGRDIGSPPVRMMIGRAKEATLSSTFAALVGREFARVGGLLRGAAAVLAVEQAEARDLPGDEARDVLLGPGAPAAWLGRGSAPGCLVGNFLALLAGDADLFVRQVAGGSQAHRSPVAASARTRKLPPHMSRKRHRRQRPCRCGRLSLSRAMTGFDRSVQISENALSRTLPSEWCRQN